MMIELAKIIEGNKTYPTRKCKYQYDIKTKVIDETKILVYYDIPYPVIRRINRIFPRYIELDTRFCFILGFIKGEGANGIGPSNYGRFTLTNSDPIMIKMFLEEFDTKNILKKSDLKKGAFYLHHNKDSQENTLDYWVTKLNLSKELFKFSKTTPTSRFGVCHLYISDVLLRRVVDILQEMVLNKTIFRCESLAVS